MQLNSLANRKPGRFSNSRFKHKAFTLKAKTAQFLSFALLSLFTIAAPAQSVDINLSNESAQFKYATLVGGSNLGRTELSLGFLYNENDSTVSDLSLLVIDVAGTKSPGLELGVGPKLYVITSNIGDAVSIGLGGQLRYKLPSFKRVNLYATAFYAPGIVSFADAENTSEISLSVGYEILPTANVYVGFRSIRVDFGAVDGAADIDETVNFGLKINF